MSSTWRTGRAALGWGLALGMVAMLLGAPPARATGPAPGLLVLLSGSQTMRDTIGGLSKAATARRGATVFVDGLPADGAVALRTYGTAVSPGDTGACTDSKRTVDFGTNNRAGMLAGLTGYHVSGDAPVAYALTQGADDVKARSTATIVLVSDGSVSCTPDPCATAAQLVAANPKLTIYVVGVSATGAGLTALRCIAEKGKGKFANATSVLEVANALEQFASSTVRPAAAAPAKVGGGEDGTTAAPIATGEYTDTLGAIGTDAAVRYYAVDRTIDQSDIGVAASIRPETGIDDGLKIEVTQSGKSCATSSATTSSYNSIVTTLAVVGVRQSTYAECTAGKRLIVKVERATYGKTTSSDPIAVTLRISEHEPVANTSVLPQKLDVAKGGASLAAASPVSVTPGKGLIDGARLWSGSTYAGTMEPGEIHTFRVWVWWGQSLGAKIIALEPKPSVKTALEKHQGALTIDVISPLGASSAYSYTSSYATNGFADVDTDPVLYRGQGDQVQAGEYTVVVGLTVGNAPDGITLPYQLVVGTSGSEAGVPTYGKPGSITTTPSATGTKASTTARAHQSDGSSSRTSPRTKTLLGLVGVVLLVGGVGGWFLLRRRR